VSLVPVFKTGSIIVAGCRSQRLFRKSILKIALNSDGRGSGFQPQKAASLNRLFADVSGSIPQFIQVIERFQRCHFRYIQFG
jgi:hypothetical protein